ncbi:MAG: hypothetical protein ABWZ40_03295 [Caulobacterales bacterium]
MTPNAEIRLISAIHGLRDVIIPAVDPGQSLAVEQSGLILAQLNMLLKHLPWLGRYQTLCKDDMRSAAQSIAQGAWGGPLTERAASKLASLLEEAACEDPQAEYNRIGFAVEALQHAVAKDGQAEYRTRVDAEMLAFSRRQVLRERTWFRDSGFDPHPEELAEIAALFERP